MRVTDGPKVIKRICDLRVMCDYVCVCMNVYVVWVCMRVRVCSYVCVGVRVCVRVYVCVDQAGVARRYAGVARAAARTPGPTYIFCMFST